MPLNGIDTPELLATVDAVAADPELARFRFRATNRWVEGNHSRSRIEGFYGAGIEHRHTSTFEYGADHPAVLVGKDQAPTPVEFLLHALVACLTAAIANVAAARGVQLKEVRSRIEGDMDLRGILGLSDEVRSGYETIRATFMIQGDASPENLREIVEQSRSRSAVFDVLARGVPIEIRVDTA